MYRSGSNARVSDEFSISLSPAGKGFPPLPRTSMSADDLPTTYIPIPENESNDNHKKEITNHHKLPGENAIHFIPVIVFLCGFILWFFSTSGAGTGAPNLLD